MSLERFFARNGNGGPRARRRTQRPSPRRAQHWRLESLEPRLLLSATPVGIIALDPLVDDALPPSTDAAPAMVALDPVAPAPDQNPAEPNPIVHRELADVQALAPEAIHRLSLAGFPDAPLAALQGIDIQLIDLPGWTVATTASTGIALDQDAAGRGWFIDQTPADDSEFIENRSPPVAQAGPAQNTIDLLTVLAHEFGHYLGLAHGPAFAGASTSDPASPLDLLMQGGIRPGARHFRATSEAVSEQAAPMLAANAPLIGEALVITPTIRWNADTSGFYDVASNWIDTTTGLSRTPTASDDVLIDRGAANPVVTVRTASAAQNLLGAESLVLGGGGTLTVSGTLSSTGQIQLSGGVLRDATIEAGTTVTGGGTLNHITLAGTVIAPSSMTVTGGLTLGTGALFQVGNGGGVFGDVTFSGDQTIGGPGEIRFVGARSFGTAGRLRITGTVTFGPGLTVDGQSGDFLVTGSLTNQGTIGPGVGSDFNIGATGQNWSNAAGGTLRADGGALVLGGNWTNAGEIAVGATAGSALYLGGSFTTAGLGTVTRSGTVGNSINLFGVLDNTGATLALNAATGSWNLLGGTLKGGTLTTAGGAQLLDTPSGGVLDGVTLRGTVTAFRLSVTRGLTLDPGSLFQMGGTLPNGDFLFGDVTLSGDQTIGGPGEIRFVGTRFLGTANRLRIAGNVTFGPGLTVDGQSGDLLVTGSLTNQGTIGPSAGGDINIGSTGQNWINAAGGTLRADGGALVLGGNWTNAGEIAVGATAGSALYLGGSFTTTRLGTITRNGTVGNSINLIGVLDNTGATLALDATTGSWNLPAITLASGGFTGGILKGGTLTTAGGAQFIVGGGTLSGLTLAGTILVASQTAVVTGGLTLAPGALFQIGGTVNGTLVRGIMAWNGDQTIGGTGEIRLSGTDATVFITGNAIIGPGITLGGQSGDFTINGSLTNQGTIQATGGSFTIGHGTGSFVNAGSMLFTNAAVQLGTQAGVTITFAAGSVFRNIGGQTKVLGTLDNTGTTLTLDDTSGAFFLADGGTIKGGTVVTTGIPGRAGVPRYGDPGRHRPARHHGPLGIRQQPRHL